MGWSEDSPDISPGECNSHHNSEETQDRFLPYAVKIDCDGPNACPEKPAVTCRACRAVFCLEHAGQHSCAIFFTDDPAPKV